MKVALNPEELRLIRDALDDKHQFQRQSGEGRVQAGAVSGVLTDVGINVADIYRCVMALTPIFRHT
jgi:hypothetical protein